MIKSLLASNCSTLCKSFMDSVVILWRPLTNEYTNAVRLFCRGIYKLHFMYKILMVVVTFLYVHTNSTFMAATRYHLS